MVVLVLLLSVRPLSAEQGVVREGGVLWRRVVALVFWGGVWFVDNPGFSLLRAHCLVVLFRRVAVAAQVSAQLADVTMDKKDILSHCNVIDLLFRTTTIWWNFCFTFVAFSDR